MGFSLVDFYKNNAMEINRQLLELLACPKCHEELLYDPKDGVLLCKTCATQFVVEKGVPLFIQASRPKTPTEISPR